MSKNTFINTRFWQDNYIADLDPSEKLLFLYYLTSPYLGLTGIYEAPIKFVALETGLDKEMVVKILKRFQESKKIIHRAGWVCVKNYPKHQSFKGNKLEVALQKEIMAIPKDILSFFIGYGYPINTLSIPSMDMDRDMDMELDRERERGKTAIDIGLFNQFWSCYPRKIGKASALKSWAKIKPAKELAEKIIASVDDHKKTEQWQDGERFIPHPATYLNQERWEDEIGKIKNSVTVIN